MHYYVILCGILFIYWKTWFQYGIWDYIYLHQRNNNGSSMEFGITYIYTKETIMDIRLFDSVFILFSLVTWIIH